jgi:hypothetical protein
MPDQVMYLSWVKKAEFNPASLTSTFQVINGTGFSDSVKIFKMYNPSQTISIELSLDGVNPGDFIPPGGTFVADLQTNHETTASYGTGTKIFRKGQLIWARTAANPTFLQIIGYN